MYSNEHMFYIVLGSIVAAYTLAVSSYYMR